MMNVRKIIPVGLWYGLGIMCGNGFDLANKIVLRSDLEAFYQDRKRIGRDVRKVMTEVDSELDIGRPEQEKLGYTIHA